MMEILDQLTGVMPLIGLVVLLRFSFTRYRNAILPSLKEKLAEDRYRTQIIANKTSPAGDAYFNALTRITTWADTFYGRRKWGFRAFKRCLTLALVYPVIAAILAWVIANTHSPGGVQIFADHPDLGGRLWRALVIVAISVAIGRMLRKPGGLAGMIDGSLRTMWTRLTSAGGVLSKAFALVGFAAAVVLAYVLAVAGVVFRVLAVFNAVSLVFVAVLVVAVLITLAVASEAALDAVLDGASVLAGDAANAVAAATIVVVTLTAAIAGTAPGVVIVVTTVNVAGKPEIVGILLFLYLALPLCNAAADFLSVAVTRSILGRLASKRPGLVEVVILLFLDLVFGLICLALLAFLLTNMLDLWAVWLPDSLPLDWRAYWQTAWDDPWQGIALWMMAATTLLPTILHMSLGMGAVLTRSLRLHSKSIRRLQDSPYQGGLSRTDRTDIAKRLIRGDAFGALLGACAVFGLGYLGWLAWPSIAGLIRQFFAVTT
jgi:hypothetical protein